MPVVKSARKGAPRRRRQSPAAWAKEHLPTNTCPVWAVDPELREALCALRQIRMPSGALANAEWIYQYMTENFDPGEHVGITLGVLRRCIRNHSLCLGGSRHFVE